MKNKPIELRWFGMPGHFIGGNECLFHMATQVGKYFISTVGEYHPFKKGEDFGERQYVNMVAKSYFETMVFKIKGNKSVCPSPASCGCDMPRIVLSELDVVKANTAGEAQKNHMKMISKYSKIQEVV